MEVCGGRVELRFRQAILRVDRRRPIPSGRILTDALAELCHARPLGRVHGDRILDTVDVVVVGIVFFQSLNKSSRGSTWFMKEHDVLKE